MDGRSRIASSRLLRNLCEHKLLKVVFLAYSVTDLSLLNIALSDRGSQLNLDDFDLAYSE